MNPLLNEEQQALREAAQEAVRALVAPVADEIDRAGSVPAELFTRLGEADLMNAGGGAADALLRLALLLEQIGRKSAAVASVVGAHSVGLMALREADVAIPLEDLGSGRALACMVCGDGLSVLDERAHGEAELVPGAVLADALVVVVSTEGNRGLYLVEGGAAGVSIGPAEELMGLAGAGIAAVTLDGAPAVAVGDREAVSTAEARLRVAQAAVAVGVARGALDVTVAEVAGRADAGDRVDRSQAVQWMLADIATQSEAARATTWYAACQASGASLDEASSMCRLMAAEAAVESTRRALQVFGERGARREAGVERLYRDAKLMEVLGGTNEEQLTRIAAHLLPDLSRD